jgi:hypothetical protein
MRNKAFLPGANRLEGRQFAFTLKDALADADADPSKVAIRRATIDRSALAGLDSSDDIDRTIFSSG